MDILTPQTTETVIDSVNPMGALTSHDLQLIPLKNFLDIDHPSTEDSSRLDWIYKFFQDQNTHSVTDMFLNIRHIESKLGMAPVGETRLSRLYNYLKLTKQLSELEQLRNSYHARQ